MRNAINAILLAALLGGCRKQEGAAPAVAEHNDGIVYTTEAGGRLAVYADTARGVVCYSKGFDNISCVVLPR